MPTPVLPPEARPDAYPEAEALDNLRQNLESSKRVRGRTDLDAFEPGPISRADLDRENLQRYADDHTDTQRPPAAGTSAGDLETGALAQARALVEGKKPPRVSRVYTASTEGRDGSQVDDRWMKLKYGPIRDWDEEREEPAAVPEGRPYRWGEVLGEDGRPFYRGDDHFQDGYKAVRWSLDWPPTESGPKNPPASHETERVLRTPVREEEEPIKTDIDQETFERLKDELRPRGRSVMWQAGGSFAVPAAETQVSQEEAAITNPKEHAWDVPEVTFHESHVPERVPVKTSRLRRFGRKVVTLAAAAGIMMGLTGENPHEKPSAGASVGAVVSHPGTVASPGDAVRIDKNVSDDSLGGSVGASVVLDPTGKAADAVSVATQAGTSLSTKK